MRINFTAKEIAAVVMEAELNVKQRKTELGWAAFIGKSDAELFDLLIRLFKLIQKPDEIRFLARLFHQTRYNTLRFTRNVKTFAK